MPASSAGVAAWAAEEPSRKRKGSKVYINVKKGLKKNINFERGFK
jgi:hypothetical protein